MEPKHFYAIGWAFVAAVCGVLAITLTWLFAVGAIVSFGIGAAVERGWVGVRQGRVSWTTVNARLPFELRSPIVRKTRDAEAEPSALGFLDFEAVADRELKRMTRILGAITKETIGISKTSERYSPRISAARNWSSSAKQALGRETGVKLDAHGRRMETQQAAFREATEAMATNYLERIRYAPADALTEVRPTIAGMRDAASGSRPNMVGMRDATIKLRNTNIQQSVNQATDRLIEILGRLVSDIDAVLRFTTDALRLIDEKVAEEAAASAVAAAESDAAQAPPRRQRKRKPAAPRS